jgi:uncharacterized iron-regulated protein
MLRFIPALVTAILMLGGAVVASELDLLPLGDPARALDLDSAIAGTFVDTRTGDHLDLETLGGRLAESRVILVGEEHTSLEQKLFHEALLRDLAARTSNLVLGMEFFQRQDDPVLARWSAGELDDDQLLSEVGWYDRGGYRFDYYAPVMHAARELGVKVVGLNVDRDIVREVNRGGLAGLSQTQRSEVGPVDVGGSDQHRYLIARYFGETVGLLPPEWFENMYAAQCVWDVVMARSILSHLRDGETMMVIVGSGHVAFDLGISRRLDAERVAAGLEPLSVVTFSPVEAPAPDPDGDPHGHPMSAHGGGAPADKPGQFVRSLADIVGVFPATGGLEAFPSLGLRLGVAESGRVAIQMAWPDTPAATVDFQHGDEILDLNGSAPSGLSDLRTRVAELEWGDRAGFHILRDDQELEVALLLEPELVDDQREVAPGFAVVAATLGDPASTQPVTVNDDEPTPMTTLVEKDGAPFRVEVRTGEVLDEIHELDSTARVIRSLYRIPRPDGTVEVRFTRDPDGKVIAASRIDRTGAEVSD